MDVRIGLLCDQVGAEEWGIRIYAEKMGVNVEFVNGKTLLFYDGPQDSFDVFINRCKSANRRLKLSELFYSLSIPVINSYPVEKNCDDKSISTLLFRKRGIPTPNTCYIPYNSSRDHEGNPVFRRREVEKVADLVEGSLHYPLVAKPVMGSWGRNIRKINGRERLVEELKKNFSTLANHVGFYVQEFIPKAFDVRSYVVVSQGKSTYIASLARVTSSDEEFISNTALGALPVGIDIPKGMERLLLDIAKAINPDTDTALLAIDTMPFMPDEGEREEVYELQIRAKTYFEEILTLKEKLFKRSVYNKETVLKTDAPLVKAYDNLKRQKSYQELKETVESILEAREILSEEVNSSPDFWFNSRNVTNVDLAEYYVSCALSMIGRGG